jgi:hypothetical protein
VGSPLWDEDILGAERRVEDAKLAGIQFEALKVHYRQTKDGNHLGLLLSAHDTPAEIVLAAVGQRFMCVLVPIDQAEQPMVPKEKRDTEEWIRVAGIIGNDPDFRQWAVDHDLAPSLHAEDAAQAIRDYCRVASRTEFRSRPEALERFRHLHTAYLAGRPPP